MELAEGQVRSCVVLEALGLVVAVLGEGTLVQFVQDVSVRIAIDASHPIPRVTAGAVDAAAQFILATFSPADELGPQLRVLMLGTEADERRPAVEQARGDHRSASLDDHEIARRVDRAVSEDLIAQDLEREVGPTAVRQVLRLDDRDHSVVIVRRRRSQLRLAHAANYDARPTKSRTRVRVKSVAVARLRRSWRPVMKLYYRPKTSGRPMRVAWLLEEIGIDYEAVAVTDTDSEEHHKRSPLGRVPVLEFDDGTLLFDSTAILFALADRYPEAGFLAPVGTRERELAYQWSLTAMTELEKAAIGYLLGKDDDSRELYRSVAAVFSDAVERCAFLVGDAFTVADIVTTGVLFASERSGFVSEESRPPLQAYFARLSARPALARAAHRVESISRPA